jgi:hypothetical protein
MKTMSLVCYLGFLAAATLLHAEPITFQDDFDRKGKEAGAPLNGQHVGAGPAVWQATSNVLTSEGAGLRVTDQGAFVGRVALPADLKEIAVEAGIRPVQFSSTPPWIAAGIGNAQLENPNFGGLFLLVYPGGIYNLLLNPDPKDARSAHAVSLKSGRITSWNPDGMNRVKIVYNRGSDSVSAFANGDEKLADAVSLKEKNLSLDCGYAGFSGFGQSSEARIVGGFTATVSK